MLHVEVFRVSTRTLVYVGCAQGTVTVCETVCRFSQKLECGSCWTCMRSNTETYFVKIPGSSKKNNHPRIHGFMELLAPPCPPNSMLGTPGVHGGLQKRNNQCSNSGLPLSCTSTLNWGVQGVLQSYLLMSMCFFEEPGIVPATVKASLRSSSSKGSNSNVASMPRTILFS